MSFGRGPFTAVPPTVTEPAVALSIPPMMASSVLLPQPEGPSRHTNSPWRILSETSSSATTVCEASRPTKVIDTWSIAIIGDAASTAPSTKVRLGAFARSRSAAMSEFYRHELVVVDGLGFGNEIENAQIFQRVPDDFDRLRIPRPVRGEAADLGIIDFGHDALAHLHDPRARFHGGRLVDLHEGHCLEPAAQETTQQFRAFVDHLVGGKYDVGVEVLLDIAEKQNVSALALLLELEPGGGLDNHAVELVAFHGRQPCRYRAKRHDLNAFRTPALLTRQLTCQPIRK